ncbi:MULTISPECIES: hypothetical protein [unclassified Afipia]|uniref:hypothetical protein n=1 Tax=unclassified Afipia TaxID=2642050 RepID=UPI0004BAE46A|nr:MULTISPECIES: hypothetical protein [unclassified Afipia]|tara:strand:- start:80 stop:247 length:168 start_codon:yes stop_codon:yes gene_type:complete
MNEKTLATAAKLPLTIVHTSETILAGSGKVPDRETGGNEHVQQINGSRRKLLGAA